MSDHKELDFLEYMIKSLVKNPDSVSVTRKVDDMGILLVIHASKEDMGYLCGRDGTTIKAIKLITKLVGFNNECRCAVKLSEPIASHSLQMIGLSSNSMKIEAVWCDNCNQFMEPESDGTCEFCGE